MKIAANIRHSLFCCCTASMEQAADGAETAAMDGLVSSWSENIFVSFCLRARSYGFTLWYALDLLVGGAIQVPQLQLVTVFIVPWKFSRSCGYRSRSGRDGHGNLVNCEPLKWFKHKLTHILTVVGKRTNYVFKVGHGFEGHQGHRNVCGQRNTDRRLVIEDHLVSTYLSVVFLVTQCLTLRCIRRTLLSSIVTVATTTTVHCSERLNMKVTRRETTDWQITRETQA